MKKLGLILLTVVFLSTLALAQSQTPSHPLSHIHPADTDFNMSGYGVFNASWINLTDNGQIQIKNGLRITDDSIQDSARNDLLLWNSSDNKWEVNENLDLNGNDVQNFFNDTCPGGEVVKHIYDNGSYECRSITGAASDQFVDEAGDTMSGNLNMSGNNISDVGYLNDFFAGACSDANDVVKQVYDNGSYQCVDASSLGDQQDLESVLDAGNSAGSYNIFMNGNNINGAQNIDSNVFEIENSTSDPTTMLQIGEDNEKVYLAPQEGGSINFDKEISFDPAVGQWEIKGGLNVSSGNLSINSNSLENVGNIYGDGSGGNFFGSCSAGQYVESINSDGSVNCATDSEGDTENLSETLTAGNVANQSIDMSENALENIDALQDNTQNTINFDGSNNVEIPNGKLDLSSNNLTGLDSIEGFFSNACDGTNEVVKQVHADGSYTCETVPEDDGAEGLPATLEANNTANQSIDMDGNNISNPGYVDGIHLDNPGTAIDINNNQYRVTPGSLTDTQISGNSLTNSSLSSFSSYTLQDLDITNDLTGTGIVGSTQIASNAVTNTELGPGAVDNGSISSFNSFTLQDLELTSDLTGTGIVGTTQLASDSVTSGKINTGAVGNSEIANNVVNRTQLDGSSCDPDEVLRSDGSDFNCVSESNVGTDDQRLDEVLSEGNFADGTNIVMNGTANLEMEGNEIQNAGKVGVGTATPDENLDVDGSANISSSGTSMAVQSDGDVVVTLGG